LSPVKEEPEEDEDQEMENEVIKVHGSSTRANRSVAREVVKKEQSPNGKVIKDEDNGKTPTKASARKVTFAGDDNQRPSKRMKIDHDEQVN
jgi:hypothetical protein